MSKKSNPIEKQLMNKSESGSFATIIVLPLRLWSQG
jgi:hypothetical protein